MSTRHKRKGIGGWFLGLVFCLVLHSLGNVYGLNRTSLEIRPRVIETEFPTQDKVIASIVIEAPRDGQKDATPAIQEAIDQMAVAGGGVIFLPSGHYRLGGSLLLREGVTLRGDWTPPVTGKMNRGTILMPVGGRGHAEGPAAIIMERGTGIREITFWYPEQNAASPIPYPWTIHQSDELVGNNHTILNSTFINSYQGLKFGPEWNELHTIRNIYGTPLRKGISLDFVTDIGRIININFSPKWWIESGFPHSPESDRARKKLREFLLGEAIAIDIGRSDWQYIYGVRVEGYNVGLLFRKGEHGISNAVMFGSEFIGCNTALRVERVNRMGLVITGSRFAGNEHAVHIAETNAGALQFNRCIFESAFGEAVWVEGDAPVSFQNCIFQDWKNYAVRADRGTISLVGSTFEKRAGHVHLGEDIESARLVANTFTGRPDIVNEAPVNQVLIDHTPAEFAQADISPTPEFPEPRPTSEKLFIVTDFGASPEAKDNTEAFTKALTAAHQAGGGTVYVPASFYRFTGTLRIPSGVELRGIFDVPHHTVSGGSVLLVTYGHGQEDGDPFIQLEPNSGLRGLTFWYPNQDILPPTPYPWTIQALGPGCWLTDITIGQAYQGVDFWTHESSGHVIRYLAGAFFKRGLFISKNNTVGWVEDLQFNPHYAWRRPAELPPVHPTHYPLGHHSPIVHYQRYHLEAIAFGRSNEQHVTRTFVFAAKDGLAFRDDEGGSNARIIMHGTDTGTHGITVAASGEKGLEFINSQLVALLAVGDMADINIEASFEGKATFFNTKNWLYKIPTARIKGSGEVIIQQTQSSGGIIVEGEGGKVFLENILFKFPLHPTVYLSEKEKKARLVANQSLGELINEMNMDSNLILLGNLNKPIPGMDISPEDIILKTGWEPGDIIQPAVLAFESHGVEDPQCAPGDSIAYSGKYSLRLSGRAVSIPQGRNIAYFNILTLEEPIRITRNTVMAYWFRPGNKAGHTVGVCLVLTDGPEKNLRDSGAHTSFGEATHPSSSKGFVGKWTFIHIPLGQYLAGHTIQQVLFAYDSTETGEFEAFIDDLVIAEIK